MFCESVFLGHSELATHGACYWYVNEAGFIRPIVRATAGPAQICSESESVGWDGGRVISLGPPLTSVCPVLNNPLQT